MKQNQWEVIFLKPTSTFLSFLAAQCPDANLPDLESLQSDTTAYAIPKQASEEATLDEIEKHFPLMFKHEISRCLGEEACEAVEGSFLDFLCSFKFELHSQIVLMEPSIAQGQQVLCIKPRSVLLKWVNTAPNDSNQDEVTNVLEYVNLSHMVENATVVVKNFKRLSEIKPFLKSAYQPLFNAEMTRMCGKTASHWPVVDSFQKFSRYFYVEVHSQLVHLH
jgi:hypothetical protein